MSDASAEEIAELEELLATKLTAEDIKLLFTDTVKRQMVEHGLVTAAAIEATAFDELRGLGFKFGAAKVLRKAFQGAAQAGAGAGIDAGGAAAAAFEQRIAALELQQKQLLPIVRAMMNATRYLDAATTVTMHDATLKEALVSAYFTGITNKIKLKKKLKAGIRCMLTEELLPRQTVTAAHLFRFSWARIVEEMMQFKDINDVRNGLLLYKPVEDAFDHLQLCLVPTPSNAPSEGPPPIVAYILDPALVERDLADLTPYSATHFLQQHSAALRASFMTKKFSDLQGRPLTSSQGRRKSEPYTRVLYYHAQQAIAHAHEQGWPVPESLQDLVEATAPTTPMWRERVAIWQTSREDTSALGQVVDVQQHVYT